MVTVLGLDQKPFAGAPVLFAVAGGSATLSPGSTQSGNDGSASTQLRLGATAGAITVTATVNGLPAVKFSLTAMDVPQIFAGGVVGAGLSTPPLQIASPNAIVSIFGKNFAPAGTPRNVTGSDPTQFKDAATQVVSPPSYAPGEIVYRFEKAE